MYDKYLVWTNYGSYEGWSDRGAGTWEEAVAIRDEQMSMGNREVIITEYCPVDIRDARLASQCKCGKLAPVGCCYCPECQP